MNENGEQVDVLYSYELPNVPGYKCVALRVTYAPGGYTPAHTHGAAFVTGVVLSGELETQIQCSEDALLRRFERGQSFSEAPYMRHIVSRNASSTEPAELLATFIAPVQQEDFVM